MEFIEYSLLAAVHAAGQRNRYLADEANGRYRVTPDRSLLRRDRHFGRRPNYKDIVVYYELWKMSLLQSVSSTRTLSMAEQSALFHFQAYMYQNINFSKIK